MFHRISLYFNTVRHLKVTQVIYQLFTRLHRPRLKSLKPHWKPARLKFVPFVCEPVTRRNFEFTFLNKSFRFNERVDFTFNEYGKLWQYNLCYFAYLNQGGVSSVSGIQVIQQFLGDQYQLNVALEPYPTSLRIINWIKFLSQHDSLPNSIKTEIDQSLFSQVQLLAKRLEFHLMGNHLLENLFALLFGAFYFQDTNLFLRVHKLLLKELNEQILSDGAHFELSPMYHSILLVRMLDCINLLKSNSTKLQTQVTLMYLSEKAKMMLAWLNAMTFNNGDIAAVNDATTLAAYKARDIHAYAERLNVKTLYRAKLKESGYRMINVAGYEVLVDVGPLGPDYIPGHGHADMLNFVLQYKSKPVIVDVGVSTYEVSVKRLFERSTEAHNTVVVNECSQSEIWSSFRVARRARIKDLIESERVITAGHDGYQKKFGIIHSRTFMFGDTIKILDKLSGKANYPGTAYFYFHPDNNPVLKGHKIVLNDVHFDFRNIKSIELQPYELALDFNRTISSTRAVVQFKQSLETEIVFS